MLKVIAMFLVLLFPGITDEWTYKHYVVEGHSMAPALLKGDRMTVDPNYYAEHPILRGDLIVFTAPGGNMYMKRVIGLPGETVTIADNQVFINGVPLDEPYMQEVIDKAREQGETVNRDFPETAVPAGSVFVLGDNRRNSSDSRMIGSIPKVKIIGKVIRFQH